MNLDVAVESFDVDVRIELERRFSRHLVSGDAKPLLTSCNSSGRTHDSFRAFDVLFLEQELPVQVAEVDRVQVEHLDLAFLSSAKASHDCIVPSELATVMQ